ncbi:hypothetical protein SD71_12105 [Cohnella kolymensis]|uniref:ATP-grasp domain-containing protein n=1 Tax=Cohnella kolymensis TaxID=1590652 RepID=A0ABR5A3K7_9BACL|nr:YheC/YheD family protein [Cohnella kolymensis]KIL35639.1 hypothetical protein SD71_12105 [Cohnella kolymensis]
MYRSITASSTAPRLVGVYLGTRTMSLSEISNHIRIRKLVEANKEVGTSLAFFSYKEVDLSKEEFTGASFDVKKKSWTKRSFPFPDVVYVRGRGGKTKDLLEKFEYLGIKRINPIHAFNKGELFEQLIQDPNVRHHLPLTVSVEQKNDIKSAILKLGKVYVKARDGRRGLHVMRVEKLSKNSGYLCTYSILGKLVSKKADNMEHLLRTIRSFFGDKKVVVQKAIDLVTISNNRLVDFRAEVQRNKKREIDIVGVCARAGQPHSPITTHSSAYRYDTYLPKLFPRYTTKQLNSLKQNIKDFFTQNLCGCGESIRKIRRNGH